MTQTQTKPWVFIVDEGGGRLLRAKPVPPGRYHVEVKDRLKNEWKEGEQGRPSGLTRTRIRTHPGGSAEAGYPFPSHENEHQTVRHMFAKDVVEWLEKKMHNYNIEHLAVFAAPKLLGELRNVWSKALASKIEEHDQDLSWMGEEELLNHPAVTKLLGADER